MNLSNANMESFVSLLDFHNTFSGLVKVASAGMLLLERTVTGKRGDYLLGALISSVDQPFGIPPRVPDPEETVSTTLTLFSNLAVVEALSSFDHFLTSAVVDLISFSAAVRAHPEFSHAHTVAYSSPIPPDDMRCCVEQAERYGMKHKMSKRLAKLEGHLGVTIADLSDLLPLFHYFRTARNCIAHSNGRASEELSDLSTAPATSNALVFWGNLKGSKPPALPAFSRGDKIEFEPRHAILASAVAFHLGLNLNDACRTLLGVDGFVEMAFFHGLAVSSHPDRPAKSNRPEKLVAYYLDRKASRYPVLIPQPRHGELPGSDDGHRASRASPLA